MRRRRWWSQIILYVVVVVVGVAMLYPVLWMVMSSFKSNSDVFGSAGTLIPPTWHASNYGQGWQGFGGVSFGRFFANSFFVVILSTLGSVVSSALIAYGFARFRFPGKRIWFVCMMATMMLPPEIVIIPQYIMFDKFHWLNTYLPLILPTFFGTPFFVFLIMQFIRTLPPSLEEAAMIDGCNTFNRFIRIIVPLIVPAIMTSAIFSFYWRWDDFLGPLIYLTKPKLYTVSLAIKMFADPDAVSNWGAMFAMATLSLLPILILFFSFQKYIVEGISTSGLKG